MTLNLCVMFFFCVYLKGSQEQGEKCSPHTKEVCSHVTAFLSVLLVDPIPMM